MVCSMRFHIEFQLPFPGFLFQPFRVIVWAKLHVGTHGLCVRPSGVDELNKLVSQRVTCFEVCRDARSVRPLKENETQMHDC